MRWAAKRAIGAVFLVSIALVFMVTATGWAADKCYICGIDLSEFGNTRYTIVTKDRKTLDLCSFYCAVMVLKDKKKVKKVSVVDYNTGKEIDAKRAVYVIGSAVKETIHSKSWLAFGDMHNAYVFILRNGGMSRNFKEAKKAMSIRLANKTQIPRLLKGRQSPGCLKCHTLGRAERLF
jgi:nitrous oxide reductase accessory protein NosL